MGQQDGDWGERMRSLERKKEEEVAWGAWDGTRGRGKRENDAGGRGGRRVDGGKRLQGADGGKLAEL